MTPENWGRLKPLFGKAIELSETDLAAFLKAVHRQDQELGRQLETLVQAHQQKTFFADKPASELAALHPREVPLVSAAEIVLERFTIVRLVGSGGMGAVYEATDKEMGRIALKTIRPDLAADRKVLSRFRQEVLLARRVNSDYVCRIHEFFALPPRGGNPASAVLTMEFLEGETLAHRIKDRGPIPWVEAEAIAVQMCRGLAAVRDANIIHRDVKSLNVMLSSQQGAPRAVLMDFGLAVEIPSPKNGDSISTVKPGFGGTPDYMAPEQLATGRLSQATDIYALGIVLYEMVTGRRPFEAKEDDSETLPAMAVRRAQPPPPPSTLTPGLPRRWDEVISRCLQFDPSRRFQSAHEVVAALTDHRSRVQKISGRYLAVAALFAGLCVASGIFLWKGIHRCYTPPQEAADWYRKGVEAFREGSYLKATELLKSALGIDKDFAIARARLADSWNELDFKGSADEQIGAVSSDQESAACPADRSYIEAVRATLHQDFQSAVQGFHNLLDSSQPDERPVGYVDLGRTYEKAGQIPAALAAYGEARKLAPDSPAAYLRSAILEARQGSDVQAGADFDRADRLYMRLGSQEGRAEVAYHRSYWQTILRQYDTAREQAQKSFNAAQNMPVPSVQLEARALCRLSAIDHGRGREDDAIEEASRAIELAHENGLEYWETDARLRQGAAYSGKTDAKSLGTAQHGLATALKAAQRNRWPRLVALAQVNLANIRYMRSQPQDIKALEAATEYYRIYQFPKESFYPLLFLARQKNTESLYGRAEKSALDLVSLTRNLADPSDIAQAEEELGTSYLGLQRYPDALQHFEAALAAANQANEPILASYETLHRAEALSRLGRFEEAEEALGKLNDDALAGRPSRIRDHILLSQSKYADVIRLTRKVLIKFPGLDPFQAADFRIVGSMAAAQISVLDQSRQWAEEALTIAQKSDDPETVANARLAMALLDLHSHAPLSAKSSAEAAIQFFETHSQKESEWLAFFYLAESEKALGNNELSRVSASKSLDFFSAFEHNWESSASQAYKKRPDVSAVLRELGQIVPQKGGHDGE